MFLKLYSDESDALDDVGADIAQGFSNLILYVIEGKVAKQAAITELEGWIRLFNRLIAAFQGKCANATAND